MKTAQQLKVHSRRALAALLILITSSCTGGHDRMYPRSIGDGDLPLEERISLEQFEAQVFPAYRSFITTLAQRSGTQPTLVTHSRMTGYGETYASLHLPMIVIPQRLSCDLIVEVSEQYFPPVGFTLDFQEDDGKECNAAWSNQEHGGIIAIGSSVQTSSYGFSGTLPLTSSRTPLTYEPPAWESELPWDKNSPDKPQSE